MIDIEDTDMLDVILANAKDMVVLECRKHNMFTDVHSAVDRRITEVMKNVEQTFEDDAGVLFCRVSPNEVYPAYARYQVNSVPSILFLSRNVFTNKMDLKAKISSSEITFENVMGLISEYKFRS